MGAHQGSMYVAWAAGSFGTTAPWSGRTVTAVEPNDYWSRATPIEIGDDMVGDAVSPDLAYDPAEIFSFHGEQGTTVLIDGTVTGSTPAGNPCFGFALYCGSDTTQIYSLGGALTQGGGTPPSHPPGIVTLPITGTYYLRAEGSGSIYTIRYRARLRELVVDPASPARDQRDVVLSASHDGGVTWTTPVRVNDDPPWWDNSLASVAVDDRGTVHVAWYGRTEGSECGRLVDVYWSSSTDGGQTFAPSQRVSRNSSLWLGAEIGPGDIGEHLGIAPTGSSAHVVWTQVGQPDLDIYYARIDLDTVTSTLLSRFAASRQDGCVGVEWEFGPGVRVDETCVYRSGETEQPVACLRGESAFAGAVCDSAAGAGPAHYRLRAQLSDGRWVWFGPVDVEAAASAPEGVLRAHPNPFRGGVRLAMETGMRPERLTVDVVDLGGRRVARLLDGSAGPGAVELEWDGTRQGRPVRAGVYFVEVGRRSGARRLRIVKLN